MRLALCLAFLQGSVTLHADQLPARAYTSADGLPMSRMNDILRDGNGFLWSFAALCAGACGYLLKKTPPPKLLESIREVVAGGAPMSPEIASRVLMLFRQITPPPKADYNLSPHELRLLTMLVEGHKLCGSGFWTNWLRRAAVCLPTNGI
jgi:hypothetical protein